MRGRPHRRGAGFPTWRGLVRLLALAALGPALSLAGGPLPEYHVKAAFLLNFARFVTWPEESFPSHDAPIVVCVYGRDPFDGEVERLVGSATVQGRRLTVRHPLKLSETGGCHILFLPSTEPLPRREAEDVFGAAGLLTVGESGDFARLGGIVTFVPQGNFVRFEINPGAAARSHLRISSKLLQLATIVASSPPDR